MEYYCSVKGRCKGISQDKPGNVEKILPKLVAGDTLYILPGTYSFDHQITIHSNGTSDSPITIVAFDLNDRPVFDFRYQPYGNRLDQDCNGFRLFGEYLYLKGIIIAYAGYKGIRSEVSHSTLEDIEVYGSCDSGIHMCCWGNNKIIRCVSHDNFGYKTMDMGRIKFGYDSDGISDKLHYGEPNTFIDCESYNNTDDGFDFFGRCTESPTMVQGCKSYNNGIKWLDMKDYPRYEVDKEWFDQFKNGKLMRTILFTTIKVTLDRYPALGNGNGFKLCGKRRYHCIELHDCEAHYNNMKGFDQNHNSGVMKLYNCDASNNKMFDFGFRESYCGDAYFENCTSKTNKVSIKCKKHKEQNCSW